MILNALMSMLVSFTGISQINNGDWAQYHQTLTSSGSIFSETLLHREVTAVNSVQANIHSQQFDLAGNLVSQWDEKVSVKNILDMQQGALIVEYCRNPQIDGKYVFINVANRTIKSCELGLKRGSLAVGPVVFGHVLLNVDVDIDNGNGDTVIVNVNNQLLGFGNR